MDRKPGINQKMPERKCPHNEIRASESIKDVSSGTTRVINYRCIDCEKIIPSEALPSQAHKIAYRKLFAIQSE